LPLRQRIYVEMPFRSLKISEFRVGVILNVTLRGEIFCPTLSGFVSVSKYAYSSDCKRCNVSSIKNVRRCVMWFEFIDLWVCSGLCACE
jgi:hypothetical protein